MKFKSKEIQHLFELTGEIRCLAKGRPDIYGEVYKKLEDALDEAEDVGLINYEVMEET